MTGIEAQDVSRLVNVYPNPFRDELTVSYDLLSGSNVSVSLFDAYGKMIRRVSDEYQSAGNHQVLITGTNLSNGIYLVKVQTGSYSVMKKAILNR
jgi:hypothetical protein